MICPKCGLRIPLDREPSYFDGKLIQLIGWEILAVLVTIITAGICYPWALCRLYGWRIKHTVINGRRLSFDGTGLQLFGNWIKWWLLSVITIGVYVFWLPIKVNQWTAKHTRIVDTADSSDAVPMAMDSPAEINAMPVQAASSPQRVMPEIVDDKPNALGTVIIIFVALACVSLVAEIAALIANLWLLESAFALIFPAWTVFAALGGAVLFGAVALILADRE